MKPEAYDLMLELEDHHWWFKARREIICSMVRKYVRPGANIIDYGGGTGGTARALTDQGFHVTVADMADESLDGCRAKSLPVIDLKADVLPHQSADCILLCDVLEHVENEQAVLEGCKDALKPGGMILVTVPAYEFLWSGEDFVSNHLRRHTRRSILRNIRAAGYDVQKATYFMSLLLPAAGLSILASRLLRPRTMYASTVKATAPWWNALLYRIFSFEQHLTSRMDLPAGMSIIALAHAKGEGP